MSIKTHAADAAFAAAYDPDDPSLEILNDGRTMTVVSINDLVGDPMMIADIHPGDAMLEDLSEVEWYSSVALGTCETITTASILNGGVLRLITTHKKGNR